MISKKTLRKMPEPLKLERTGENTFVISTNDGSKFEGKFNSKTHTVNRYGKIVPR